MLFTFFGDIISDLVSFLGPKGTFTHEVAEMIGDELIPCCTIPAVMESIVSGNCSKGVVPIENSIEGPVGVTLDSLAHRYDLNIVKEIIIPINQHLIVNNESEMEDIEDVYSHQQAIAQCSEFIAKNNIQTHYAISTANAAKSIIGFKSKAAIGNIKSAELYGLKVLKKNIQDVNNNETRFIALSKEDTQPTGNDKTSIIFSIYEDRPGSLYNILGIFEKDKINLTKIESRPSKQGLGKYLFFVDFYGHQYDDNIKRILKEVEDNSYFFKILGSYPEFK